VILVGNPGTGKTHVLIGLGMEAIRQSFRVRFVTAGALVNELLVLATLVIERAGTPRSVKPLLIARDLSPAQVNHQFQAEDGENEIEVRERRLQNGAFVDRLDRLSL